MLNKHFVGLFCFAIVITAFKAQPSKPWKVKQSVNLLTGSSASYFYREDGRVLRIENSKGVVTTYTYTGNSVIKRTEGKVESLTPTDTIALNANGMATALNSAGSMHTMKYDSLGRFIESLHKAGNLQVGKGVWTWGGNNQATYTYYNEHGKVVNQLTYEYYTNRLNTIGDVNRGMPFWGRDSKNLVKRSYATTPDSVTAEYNYRFNNEGAVTLKVSYSNGIMTDSTSYTYY